MGIFSIFVVQFEIHKPFLVDLKSKNNLFFKVKKHIFMLSDKVLFIKNLWQLSSRLFKVMPARRDL